MGRLIPPAARALAVAAVAEDEPMRWKALPARWGDTLPVWIFDCPYTPGVRRPDETTWPPSRPCDFVSDLVGPVVLCARLGNSGTVASWNNLKRSFSIIFTKKVSRLRRWWNQSALSRLANKVLSPYLPNDSLLIVGYTSCVDATIMGHWIARFSTNDTTWCGSTFHAYRHSHLSNLIDSSVCPHNG